MIKEYANAKINLGIDVPYLRDDGYHEVDMIMQSLKLADTITIEENAATSDISLTIVSNPLFGDIDVSTLPTDDRNLCVRAARLLLEESGVDKGLCICLEKRIPFEAGLGGGSSDAAAVLRAINTLFDLGIPIERLMELSVSIGADVPFCVRGGIARLRGIGEVFKPVSADFSGVPVLLVKPDFGISTAAIYKALDSIKDPVHPDIDDLEAALCRGSILDVAGNLGNILEDAAIQQYPVINSIKKEIKETGAVGSLMTGSGSTVFGLFDNEERAQCAAEKLKTVHPGWFIETTATGKKQEL